jgi:hypothetical protein
MAFDTGHMIIISETPSITHMDVMATKVHARSRPPGPAVFMTSPPVENTVTPITPQKVINYCTLSIGGHFGIDGWTDCNLPVWKTTTASIVVSCSYPYKSI